MKSSTLLKCLMLASLSLAGGCRGLGYLGYLFAPAMPDKYEEAEFGGLAKHSVAIVIYADPDAQYEYPHARLDLAGRLGAELQQNVKDIRVTDPRKVVRYQDENLDWDAADRTKLGKDFGVDYVLYISLAKYTMREPGSEYLYRGEIIADVAVHQVSLPERQSRVFVLNGFRVSHPPEAVPADNDILVRTFADAEFATRLAKKFYRHKLPKEE